MRKKRTTVEQRRAAKAAKRARATCERVRLRKLLVAALEARGTPAEVWRHVVADLSDTPEPWRIQWWIDAVTYNPPAALMRMTTWKKRRREVGRKARAFAKSQPKPAPPPKEKDSATDAELTLRRLAAGLKQERP